MEITIQKETETDRQTWFLEGRMDTSSSPQFKKKMEECPEGVKKLTLDFKKVPYVSSAGLRELLSAHKRISAGGGRMVVRGLNEQVREVFVITGFLNILHVEES